MPGTDENELTECQRPEMADENSASLLAASLSCVSPTHFEVRQLLRHLRPRCGSAAASSSLFTERLAFSRDFNRSFSAFTRRHSAEMALF